MRIFTSPRGEEARKRVSLYPSKGSGRAILSAGYRTIITRTIEKLSSGQERTGYIRKIKNQPSKVLLLETEYSMVQKYVSKMVRTGPLGKQMTA
jgi:hypothetical protein